MVRVMHFRRPDRLVAEQLLYDTDIRARIEKRRRKRIAEAVRVRVDAGRFAETHNRILQKTDAASERRGTVPEKVIRTRRIERKRSERGERVRMQPDLDRHAGLDNVDREIAAGEVDRIAAERGD